ncbi:MAG: conjugal transfer protein [Isosphaera sp.]|nr:conjugal transfer protein [Isosphaera sp.]
MRFGLALAAAAGLLAGCGTEAPDVPMPTDGPNQVVVKVPGMT